MTLFEGLAFLLLGALAVGGTVLLLMVMWSAARARRVIDQLARTPCPVCRAPLGRDTVEAGRRLAAELMQEQQSLEEQAQPSAQVDVAPYWPLVCPRCQSQLAFNPESGEWVLVKHPHEAE